MPRLGLGLGHRAAVVVLLAHGACSTGRDTGHGIDAAPQAPHAPPAPAQLVATGSLRKIQLSWSASAGGAGYHVYRSGDGAEFSRLTADPVTATSYDDPIGSPAGDGVLYRYKVTAVGDLESECSNIVATMHGTRLVARTSGSFQTARDDSPYVAEHTTVVDGGLWVRSGTELYVLDGAVLDFLVNQDSGELDIDGLIRSTPSGSAPARFTAHRRDGAALLDGQGLMILFQGVAYDPSDGSGSQLEHIQIEHLAQFPGGALLRGGLVVLGSPLKLRNAKLSGARSDGHCRLSVQDTWIILEDSYLDKLVLGIADDMRDTPFKVAHNVFRHSASPLMDPFGSMPAVSDGQIDSNDLDGVEGPQLNGLSVPLENNYWAGATGSPGPGLAEPPVAGPNW